MLTVGKAGPIPTTSPRVTDHYHEMDALRGVAAIIVVFYHFAERAGWQLLVARGYLGVDFFFVLSGFVMAHAYGDKLSSRRLGLLEFVRIRLIRLMPMVILSITIGAAFEWVRPVTDASAHKADVVTAWIKGCLLVPTLGRSTLEYVIFPLNGPIWSLFFEIVANVVLAASLLLGVSRGAGVLAWVASLGAMIWVALLHNNINYVGAVGDLFFYGFPRVCISFCIGLALYRIRQLSKIVVSGPMLAISLICVCLIPRLPEVWNGAFDLLAILALLPAIVFAAASEAPRREFAPLVRLAGLVSYPLYALHYPFVRVVGFFIKRYEPTIGVRLAVVLGATIVLIGVATLCVSLYDLPVRRWLNRRTAVIWAQH